MNSNEFLLDSGFWGFLYKILTPVEWLQTWIMKIVHDFFVMLGVSPIGVSWVLAIIILVLVVQACIFPLFFADLSQADEVDAQDAGIGAEDAAYSEQVQRQDGSGFQGGHEP